MRRHALRPTTVQGSKTQECEGSRAMHDVSNRAVVAKPKRWSALLRQRENDVLRIEEEKYPY